MRQLSGLDTAFLNLETTTAPMHVSSLTVLDDLPEGFGYDVVRDLVAERVAGVPTFREVLHHVPFGLDLPYWRVDPDFDVEFHVRHSAVPGPGDDVALARLVARLHARPLDRTRPLWELYVIEGLQGGRVGLFTKLHHAAADGLGGMDVGSVLLDATPDAPRATSQEPLGGEPPPPAAAMLARSARGVVRAPQRLARSAVRAAREAPVLSGLATMALPGPLRGVGGPSRDGGLIAQPTLQAPPTPFNAPVTAHRQVAWGILSLADAKAIKTAQRTTVNDVLVAIVAGALRQWLLARGELPGRPLQAMIPISVRTSGSDDGAGNRVTAMIGLVPTHLDDALERLRWVHDQMATAKDADAIPADVLQEITGVAPPVLAARAARVAARLRWAERVRLPYNLVISNVPGPRVPLYVAGARLVHMIPVSAIQDGLGLNVTMISHEDDIDVGLVADREQVEDLWALRDLVVASASELAEAAGVR